MSHEDGHMTVNQEELSERCLVLHEGLAHGDVVEVLDTWCDRSYPGSILSSSAFTKARPCPRRSSLYVLAQLVYMLAQLVYACAACASLLRLHILAQGMGTQHGQLVQPVCSACRQPADCAKPRSGVLKHKQQHHARLLPNAHDCMQVIRQHKPMRVGGHAPQQQPAVGEAIVRFKVCPLHPKLHSSTY